MIGRLTLCTALVWLTACTTNPDIVSRDGAPEDPPNDVHEVADAAPRIVPRGRYRKPKTYKVLGKTYKTLGSSEGFVEQGQASYYGAKFHGRRTSSGERYDMHAMTAAHKHLPLPTYVEATNLDNGRSVVVRVNDRGPFHSGRIIDLSYAAAVKLGITKRGVGRVEIRAIDPDDPETRTASATARHFVQAGAFSDRANAKSLEQRLWLNYGHDVIVQPVHAGDEAIYRVMVGPLASKEDALNLTSTLRDAGVGGAHTLVD